MPETINGIPVPVEGDPTSLPADLAAFATALATVLAEHLSVSTEAAEAAGAAAATAYASGLDDAKMTTVASNPASAFAAQQSASIDALAGPTALADTDSAQRVALDALYADPSVIEDAIGEWWLYPAVTMLYNPYPRAVFGGISEGVAGTVSPRTGGLLSNVVVCEFDFATNTTTRVVVGTADTDDHDAPALHIETGHRPIIAWQNHLNDTYLRVCVGGANGDVRAWGPQYDLNLGTSVSYAQIHRITSLCTTTEDVYWVLFRSGVTSWSIVTLTVDVATGTMFYSDLRQVLSTTEQCYVSSAPAYPTSGQVLRIAFGYNPAAALHAVHYLELDCATGAFSSPFTAGITANYLTATALPITAASLTPAIAEPSAGNSRRLFYVRPGPAQPAIAYADWATATPDNATYKMYRKQQGDSYDGLLAPIGVNVETPHHASLNQDSNFTYETAFKCTGAPTSTLYFGWRWNSSDATQQIWRASIGLDRKVTFNWRTSGSSVRTNTTTNAVPGNWTDDLGLGLVFDWDGPSGTNASVGVYYSANPTATTPTWTLLETMSIGTAAHMLTGTRALAIGFTTTTSSVRRYVYYARLKDGSGTVVAEAPFSTLWTRGAATYTDTTGKVWTITGGGTVGHTATTWVTETFGTAGPRIGYNVDANYLPGMSFPDPAYDDTLMIARRNSGDTQSTVEEWRLNAAGAWESRTLLTSSDKLARPMFPKNGGPAYLVSQIRRYNGFTDFLANLRRVPRD